MDLFCQILLFLYNFIAEGIKIIYLLTVILSGHLP